MTKKIIAAAVAAVLCISAIIGFCVIKKDGYADTQMSIDAENLSSTKVESVTDKDGNAVKKVNDGNIKSAWNAGEKKGSVTVTYSSPQAVDTVVIREKGWNIRRFTIAYLDDATQKWTDVYNQDLISDYRMCAIKEVTAKAIRVTVDESDAKFSIREIETYRIGKTELDSFKVTNYVATSDLISGKIYDPNTRGYMAPEYFDVVKQIHVIASAHWDGKGGLLIENDLTMDEMKALIDEFRAHIGGRDVDVLATFFVGNDPDAMITTYKNETIANTIEFLTYCGFDGISYDWEYPSSKQWVTFSEHLVALKTELNKYDMKLSLAVAAWAFDMGKEAVDAIDQIEIMAYDMFDLRGNHSSFMSGAVQPVNYFLKKGFPPEKIILGIPFYGRPEDGSAVWRDFGDPEYTPADRFTNYSNGICFSGTQLTADKTAYVIANKLGGIMIFMVSYDLWCGKADDNGDGKIDAADDAIENAAEKRYKELGLFNSIKETMHERLSIKEAA